MKENLDYFRHYCDAHNHPKFAALILEYGWEGYGKFWALNEIIGNSSTCWLDLSKRYVEAEVARALDFTIEELEKFVEFLESSCELLIHNGKKITTKRVQEYFLTVKTNRELSRLRKSGKFDEKANSLSNQQRIIEKFDEKNKRVEVEVEVEVKKELVSENDIPFTPEDSPEKKKPKTGTAKAANIQDSSGKDKKYIPLSELLISLIETNDERHFFGKNKAKIALKWAKPIRLLIETDGRTQGEVETVIKWCQGDTFWKKNILSTAKLREKFGRLLMGMKEYDARDSPESPEPIASNKKCGNCGKKYVGSFCRECGWDEE